MIFAIFFPGTSFIGHLSGLIIGYTYDLPIFGSGRLVTSLLTKLEALKFVAPITRLESYITVAKELSLPTTNSVDVLPGAFPGPGRTADGRVVLESKPLSPSPTNDKSKLMAEYNSL